MTPFTASATMNVLGLFRRQWGRQPVLSNVFKTKTWALILNLDSLLMLIWLKFQLEVKLFSNDRYR